MTTNSPINPHLKRLFVIVASLFFAISMLMIGLSNILDEERPQLNDGNVGTTYHESVPVFIPLSSTLSDPNQEISGLAWADDSIILLPQYPSENLYRITTESLRRAIAGDDNDLIAIPITFDDTDIRNQTGRFEGYEAIAFDGDVVYLTIEARTRLTMHSYFVRGRLDEDTITLDATTVLEIPQPTNISNAAHEAIVILDGSPTVIYERNDAPDTAIALRLANNGDTWETINMPPIPYRITDASDAVDNIFWVMNYNFDDPNQGDDDALVQAFGIGETHMQYDHVERLLELRYRNGQITLSQTAPVYLRLIEDARNWEGLVRFDNGWLIATDKFPMTLLAFIPQTPEN